MNRDLLSNVSHAETLAPVARTASVNGTGVDLQGFDSAAAILHVGDWTDGAFVFELQESDDNVSYTAVADSDLQGDAEPTVDGEDDDDQIYRIGYIGGKRYIRLVATEGSSPVPSTGCIFGAMIERGHPALSPVT